MITTLYIFAHVVDAQGKKYDNMRQRLDYYYFFFFLDELCFKGS